MSAAVAGGFLEIGAHPVAQIFGLADVDDLAVAPLHQIDAGLSGQGVEFEAQVIGACIFHLNRLEVDILRRRLAFYSVVSRRPGQRDLGTCND